MATVLSDLTAMMSKVGIVYQRSIALSNVPQFTGSMRSLTWADWATLYVARMKVINAPLIDYVASAKALMSTGPLEYAELSTHTEWAAFDSYMREGPWANRLTSFNLRMQLLELNLGDKPVADLIKSADNLFKSLTPPPSEQEKIFFLQRAVYDVFGDAVLTDKDHAEWSSYQDLARWTLNFQRGRKTPSAKGSGGGGGGSKRPHPNADKGSKPSYKKVLKSDPQAGPSDRRKPYAERDALPAAERKELMTSGNCFVCKEHGHRYKDPDGKGGWVCKEHPKFPPPPKKKK